MTDDIHQILTAILDVPGVDAAAIEHITRISTCGVGTEALGWWEAEATKVSDDVRSARVRGATAAEAATNLLDSLRDM
jgi:hypothetical protein